MAAPDRYSRQERFTPFGPEGQAKLGQSRVAIVGCGALGSYHAAALARAGVGFLRLIDRDYVEWNNLQRQWLYEETDAAEATPKAIAAQRALKRINSSVDVDAEVADILIAEGFTSLEEVAYVPMQEMLEIEAFDEDTVTELRTRAKDALLTMEIAKEEKVEEVSQDLRDLEGVTPELLAKLAAGDINTRDDLADLAVDELVDLSGMDEAAARALIMKAREHWFNA